jgi:hypothetical protein
VTTKLQLRRRVAAGSGAGVLAIAVSLAIAGQQSSAPVAAAPVPTLAGEMTPPVLTPSEQQALPVTTGKPVPGVAKGKPLWDGCETDLLKVLQKNEPSRQLAEAEVDCHEGYAVARTDAATVLFRYSEQTGAWRAISDGNSPGCAAAPAAVRKQLQGCS